MYGIGPKLPLLRDPRDGFALTKTTQQEVKQNLKNLVLTSPGERVMDISFGVGIRSYLFQQNTETVKDQIQDDIFSQVGRYMPFVQISEIRFGEDPEIPEKLYIQIKYSIAGNAGVDILQLGII